MRSQHNQQVQCTCYLLFSLLAVAGCQQMEPWLKSNEVAEPPATSPPAPREASPLENTHELQLMRARRLEQKGHEDEAIRAYARLVTTGNPPLEACHRLAKLHDRRGEFHLSAGLYQQCLAQQPDHADVHCDYGYSYYLQQRWPEAEFHLRQALTLRPRLDRAHNNLGLVLACTGRPEEALGEFVRAGNREAEARANLGLCLARTQQWDQASREFELSLAADPECEAAQIGYATLKRAMERKPREVATVSYEAPLSPTETIAR